MFEEEAKNLYYKLIKEQKGEQWRHSPVCQGLIKKYADYFQKGVFKIEESSILGHPGRYKFFKKYIEKEIPDRENILEIGGGFGGLCAALNFKNYYFVDFPEIIPLAYWYLKNKGKEVNYITPWDLPKLDAKIDLFVSTMSFCHMTRENLEYYFNEIARLKPNYLFIVSRNWKKDPTDLIMDDYPIPMGYQLVKETKIPSNPIHLLIFRHHNHLIRVYKYVS